jgi:hypothetical protein
LVTGFSDKAALTGMGETDRVKPRSNRAIISGMLLQWPFGNCPVQPPPIAEVEYAGATPPLAAPTHRD